MVPRHECAPCMPRARFRRAVDGVKKMCREKRFFGKGLIAYRRCTDNARYISELVGSYAGVGLSVSLAVLRVCPSTNPPILLGLPPPWQLLPAGLNIFQILRLERA